MHRSKMAIKNYSYINVTPVTKKLNLVMLCMKIITKINYQSDNMNTFTDVN